MNVNLGCNDVLLIAIILSLLSNVVIKIALGENIKNDRKYNMAWLMFIISIIMYIFVGLVGNILLKTIGAERIIEYYYILYIITAIPSVILVIGWVDVYEALTGNKLFRAHI
jgi:hypothetical protein